MLITATLVKSPRAMTTYAHSMPITSTAGPINRGTTTPTTVIDAMRAAIAARRCSPPAMSMARVFIPGMRVAPVAAVATAKASTCQSSTESVNANTARAVADTPLNRDAIRITSILRNRSINTPPQGANTVMPIPPTPAVAPTQKGESVTSSASQPCTVKYVMRLTSPNNPAVQKRRKCGLRKIRCIGQPCDSPSNEKGRVVQSATRPV